jgi:quercetin dioxygenase-like cupin family protein
MTSSTPFSERRWLPAPQEGVELCVLHSREENHEVAALLCMREGSKLPRHDHPGGEHIYVLEGCARVDGELVRAGDYHHTSAGESHDVVAEERCLFLSVLAKCAGRS